jgi:hypothetical protein
MSSPALCTFCAHPEPAGPPSFGAPRQGACPSPILGPPHVNNSEHVQNWQANRKLLPFPQLTNPEVDCPSRDATGQQSVTESRIGY